MSVMAASPASLAKKHCIKPRFRKVVAFCVLELRDVALCVLKAVERLPVILVVKQELSIIHLVDV
jgi:hypothetical protein